MMLMKIREKTVGNQIYPKDIQHRVTGKMRVTMGRTMMRVREKSWSVKCESI